MTSPLITCNLAANEIFLIGQLLLFAQVKKKRAGRDGKIAGLVPALYVSS
jgi:hypothetical protein